jgi:GDPmannose 4,6-dehydratase
LLVDIAEHFFRPAEVEILWGDATKAEKELGWKRKVGFHELVRMMVKADLEEVANSGDSR